VSTLAGLALAVTAVALWIAAVPSRAPRRWQPAAARPWWPATARMAGFLAAAGAAPPFAVAYGAVPGAVIAATAVTGVASLAVVSLAVFPRATWALLAAGPALAALSLVLGGFGV
jgi:hypothetical protein